MTRTLISIAAAMTVVGLLAFPAVSQTAMEEPPFFAEWVARGDLPPVAERLPETPSVVDLAALGKEPGAYGGTLRTLMGRAQDTRMMVVYGYARLVAYDAGWNLRPDILERFEVDEGRIFTFYLRKGHKWSDGHPFTAEDFRYYWEDVIAHEEMSPGGMPMFLRVDGQPPTVEVIDETTVRYSWDKPNRAFLPALAGARPEFIYQPSHYLKQFHAEYADPVELARRVSDAGQRNWIALHYKHAAQYKNDNPQLPTLQPWRLVTEPPASYFVFERNPFYHCVDPEGRQLPYIDAITFPVVNAKLIPAKTAAGDSDLQARGLGFENFAILKQGEKRHDFTVRLWRSGAGSEMALYPNLNTRDPVWRAVLREPKVRQAMSLAIDRSEINQTVFFGLADEGANTILPESPLYEDRFARAYTEFDLAKARDLLDAAGLSKTDGRGIRLLPNGEPFEIIVETAGEDPVETDVLQLVRDTWAQVGIKMHIKPLQREVWRNRIVSGATVMSIWKGMENALPTPSMPPSELAPTSQLQYMWPRWGQFAETQGQAGEPVDLEPVVELVALQQNWERATDDDERAAIWKRMLGIHADHVFSIGLVRAVPQPVVVSNSLRNVPEKGIYNWEPGAHFGVHRPDTFWFAEGHRN